MRARDLTAVTAAVCLAAAARLPAEDSSLHGSAFLPQSPDMEYEEVWPHSRNAVGGGVFEAPLLLETGVLLTSLRLVAYDDANDAEIRMNLVRCPLAVGACTTVATIGTGVVNEINPVQIALNEEIDNRAYSYKITLEDQDDNFDTAFRSVHAAWFRQVAPEPASPSFSDVSSSSDLLYQSVEALAAADIAFGCAAGRFCPFDPVTRGQFAVILGRALGLHYPN